jgi:ribosome-binding ATPase YchF (GTP1/OBG family)
VDTELVLADLATVERRMEKTRAAAKGRPKETLAELDWLETLRDHLDGGGLARAHIEQAPPAAEWARDLALVTDKVRLYVANVAEGDLPDGGPLARQVVDHAAAEGAPAVVLCAQLEAELLELSDEDAASYRAEIGLAEPGLDRLVRAGYDLLELITFFTTTGGEIVQAWTVPRGTAAPRAAGQVHTDMERGFIRAEVASLDDVAQAGSIAATRQAGRLRLEGHDYVVQDGDVIHFRFNV